jgi:hypothetical protein
MGDTPALKALIPASLRKFLLDSMISFLLFLLILIIVLS